MLPGGTTDVNTKSRTLHYPNAIEAIPLYPHKATLQWQLELGIPGLVLGLAIVVWIISAFGGVRLCRVANAPPRWQWPLARSSSGY